MLSKSRLQLVALLVLLLTSLSASAQQYSMTTYDRKSGLESQSINVLLQDQRGFVWAGTEMGLYRYDGGSFERMGAAQGFDHGEYVTTMAQSPHSGRLWVGTQSGMRVGNGLHFSKVEPQGKPLIIDTSRQIVALGDDRLLLVKNDELMVLSGGMAGQPWQLLPMFSEAQLAAMPQLRKITAVQSTPTGLWFGCDQALCSVDASGKVILHGQADGVPSDTWTGLLLDREGTLWLRGVHHLLALLPGTQHFVARDLLAEDTGVVSDNGVLVEDAGGHLLTPTNRGLARWDGDGWTRMDSSNGLPDIEITALLFDNHGTLWMGTYGRGISRWNGYGLVDGWGLHQGFDSVPNWSILRFDAQHLWFADELGGSVLADGQNRLQPWPIAFTPAPRQILSIAKAKDGAIWAALYDHRVLRYDAVSRRTTLAAELPTFIRFLHFDQQGRLWIVTNNGIYHIDHADAPAERVPVADSTGQQCSDIAEGDDGTLWFACNAGVVRFAGEQWTRMQQSGTASRASGFSTIAVDRDGSLWLGTNEAGLLHAAVRGNQLSLAHIEDAWLDNTLAYFVRRDHRGWIWVGGGGGVDAFDGQRWTHLSQANGLLWDETSQNGFFEDRDGSIWIGTAIGASHILHPEAMLAHQPGEVLITTAVHGALAVQSGDSIPLDGKNAALTVRYALLGKSAGLPPRYRYRLQGSGWVETNSNEINLTGLSAGSYRLEIQAIDDDHRTVSPPASFDFRIPPPWWLSWWAQLLAVSVLALLLVLSWHWRSRQLHGRNRRLEAMVEGRTVELTEEKRELELARAELYHQATHDSLTGMHNRRAILEHLAVLLEPERRPVPGLAVGLIDADHFKRVNDTLGHQAGDAALVAIARHLQSHIRGGDQLGRYGGEEILLLLPDISRADAEQRMGHVQSAVSSMPHLWNGDTFNVTLSIGVVWVGQEAAGVEDLIQRADAALYEAKSRGRDRVVLEAADGRLGAG
ncbi:diguanylate cyclase [Rhodanobacter sp. AS-Z3]|uniref:ligand-binding sensor domain-containing diguanylate cyclase n=1 Tax=Rhodanobacter sp. AS-Z3 TaxID=3031330 RepID=UPI00247A81DD|nr:diguanylate cyclase [Rhodanobacter sp. AS-Z3]WEN16735.1 diguanylate cyclase [Rhodanobacter sp. AS-Z3]